MEKRGEPVNMRSLFGEARAEGITIGEARGEKRGITIGEKRGITIGEKRGIAIGEDRVRHSIMENLIAGGMTPQDAARYTGLSVWGAGGLTGPVPVRAALGRRTIPPCGRPRHPILGKDEKKFRRAA